MSDNILFEIKQKKQNIQLKRNAFLETMSDFNLKNLNMEIKDIGGINKYQTHEELER